VGEKTLPQNMDFPGLFTPGARSWECAQGLFKDEALTKTKTKKMEPCLHGEHYKAVWFWAVFVLSTSSLCFYSWILLQKRGNVEVTSAWILLSVSLKTPLG
jgi:hypothetical protein